MTVSVTALAATSIGAAPAQAARPDEAPSHAAAARPHSTDGTPARVRSRAADTDAAVAVRTPPAVRWPAPGTAEVTTPSAADRTPALVRAGKLPVRVGAVASAARGAAVASPVRVQMFGRAEAVRAGVSGVVLRVAHPDGVDRPSTLEVDYSGFRHAYGGDYAARLVLVRLPENALAAAGNGSAGRSVVPATNDAAAGRLTARVTDGLYAVTADGAGSTGSFKPTSLSPSATWQVGLQSGDFAWSYPMEAPATPGPEPEVGLSYSSGSVDGRVAGTNNQPSWIGEGFDYQPGFIERSYRSCAEDGQAATVQDLCWASNNAVLSLPGASGPLVRDDATGVWRVGDDEGWRVELRTGATNGDNDGEHWRLTSPDGTQYFFGLNRLPGWQAGNPETNSAWTVPVFGNQSGEPCNTGTFVTSWCQQGYRWALDHVVDPHGDAMSLYYNQEINYYARGGITPTPYVRGGSLKRIEYGQRADALFSTPASAQVLFTVADRCIPGTACVQSQPQDWPDTPWDQWCGAASCTVPAPSFWTTKRLAQVTTQVRSGGAAQDVESWTLTHSYPRSTDPSDPTDPTLWLDAVVHTGYVNGTQSLPAVTFDGTTRPNRVDAGNDGRPQFHKRRLQAIYTESGARINVSYRLAECLPTSLPPVDNNDKRCFPAKWGTGTSINQEFFHKYVVDQVTESDLVGGSPDVVTSYEYVMGGHAWRHDDAELVPEARKSWGQWRGYQTVRVRTGPVGGQRTLTEHVFLRGMDGDVNLSGPPDSGVKVDGIDDRPQWAGFARMTTEYDGDGGPWLERTISTPDDLRRTARRALPNGQAIEAYLTVEKSERQLTALADGTTRTTETVVEYDGTYGTVTRIDDQGDLATTADDTCTRYTYTRNDAAWIVDTESREEVVSVGCAATAGYPDDLISDERYFYDGQSAWGAPPKAGDVTRTQEVASWSGGPVYVDAGRLELDRHGRVTAEVDALGNRQTTSYTPAVGGPVTSVSMTNALGHTATTTVDPLLGVPVKVTDANNRVTEMSYDALGRLVKGWAPGRSKATQSPTVQFSYLVRNDGPSSMTAQTLLGNGSSYLSSYTILDGFLRERQTQAPSPAGGRVLTDTRYDAYGQVDRVSDSYWNGQAGPGTALVDVPDASIPALTRYVYDGAGREIAEIFLAAGAEKWRTTTSYGGNWVAEDPPAGDTATMTVFDADGRTVELRQFTGGAPTGGYDATRYTYTRAGQLATVTDPAGNVWRHSYDLRGRETRTEDPDTGTRLTTFDDGDRVLSTTDSRGRTLAYTYDELDRKTAMFDGSTAGTKLAEWTYDTLAGGKGLPTGSTRYAAGRAYQNEVYGYDAAGRPTGSTITIPSEETGLGGTYRTRVTYNAADQVTAMLLPKVGDIPSETLQYGYDTGLGLATTLRTATAWYVAASAYTELSETRSYSLGASGSQVVRDFTYELGTRRLASAVTRTRTTSETVQSDVRYTYDPAGNVTRIADQATGDRQCFTSDYLRRLTEAWTPSGDDCATAPATTGLGGPAPYWHSYRYDKVGNRLSEVQHAAGGDITRGYAYPAAGSDQPHTLRSVTTTGPGGSRTDSYGYDSDGNTTTRTVAGAGQTLTWDAEGRLASVTEGGRTTSYLYDADGNRLIRRDPTGTTVYLGTDELRQPAGGGAAVGTRYYTHAGDTMAVRTGGQLTWLVPDHHGTGQLAVNAVSLAITRRYQLPFGAERGAAPAGWPGEKGFVGGTIDASSGLTHLGAREYDPGTGRFISVDPIIDVNDPQQMHGYAYGNNNPATLSDPDGLKAKCSNPRQCDGSNAKIVADAKKAKAKVAKAKPKALTGHPTTRVKPKPKPKPKLTGHPTTRVKPKAKAKATCDSRCQKNRSTAKEHLKHVEAAGKASAKKAATTKNPCLQTILLCTGTNTNKRTNPASESTGKKSSTSLGGICSAGGIFIVCAGGGSSSGGSNKSYGGGDDLREILKAANAGSSGARSELERRLGSRYYSSADTNSFASMPRDPSELFEGGSPYQPPRSVTPPRGKKAGALEAFLRALGNIVGSGGS
ncbi:RHS repeat-associated core domain-containing protein [Micromonospora sp. HK10]|uniref:RHS repeat-associated core domain-containing protein n=1 Tax=Micromonospora sp. HK10 TaxID=1538294 RepID=UPI0006982C22|nr:RHS repeat-associated core domain-containing protein [Micromonospora sp. HK10]